ncbi:choline/ethanolamine kinase family protein [Marinimicrobium agarilyticum]|uniref:choline/ethanolamine kinase family protein n=1 Tax=Marinimicrobium agarilyticum TaxID=306546 RepID=UPI0004104DCF|nr:choline/ethanolamine kinase family protein [Marinimicrobium agarilyticum]
MLEAPGALEQALDTWPDWGMGLKDRPRVIAPVPGGRTNRSYQLHAPGLPYELLLRLNNPRGESLGIQREHEERILETVAAAGITRGAGYWSPDYCFTVFRHIDARTWNASDLENPYQRRRLLEMLARVHQLEPETPRRRYQDYLSHYWHQLEAAGAIEQKLAQGWNDFWPRLVAFDRSGWEPVLTHHDLIPENILESDERLYLIDWEYAAVGHPDIDRWCLDPSLVVDPFVHELAQWTNDLWERVVALNSDGADQ